MPCLRRTISVEFQSSQYNSIQSNSGTSSNDSIQFNVVYHHNVFYSQLHHTLQASNKQPFLSAQLNMFHAIRENDRNSFSLFVEINISHFTFLHTIATDDFSHPCEFNAIPFTQSHMALLNDSHRISRHNWCNYTNRATNTCSEPASTPHGAAQQFDDTSRRFALHSFRLFIRLMQRALI